MNKSDLEFELSQFIGTENYYRFNSLKRNDVLTDGTMHLADQANCFWLMDEVSELIRRPQITDAVSGLLVAKIKKSKNDSAVIEIQDGNYNKLTSKKIEFTDFVFDEFSFFVSKGDLNVYMLKSEY